MSKKHALNDGDEQLFRASVAGTKTLRQDTYVHRPLRHQVEGKLPPRKALQEQVDASFIFPTNFSLNWTATAPRVTYAPAAAITS